MARLNLAGSGRRKNIGGINEEEERGGSSSSRRRRENASIEKEKEKGAMRSGDGEDSCDDNSCDDGSDAFSRDRQQQQKGIRRHKALGKKDNDSYLTARFSDMSLSSRAGTGERKKQRSLKSSQADDLFLSRFEDQKDGKERKKISLENDYGVDEKKIPKGEPSKSGSGIGRSYNILEEQSLSSSEKEDKDKEEEEDDEEEFDSLDDFIVGDEEDDISYYETDGEEVEETEEEIFTRTSRRSPRKLFRGKPPATTEHKTEKNTMDSFDVDTIKLSVTPALDKLMEEYSDKDDSGDSCDDRISPSSSNIDLHPSTTCKKNATTMEKSKERRFSNNKLEHSESTSSKMSPSPHSLQEKSDPVGLITPPGSPSKPRLKSPSKTQKRIPPSPHKPNLDLFWDQGHTNEWNEKFSPRKMQTPRRDMWNFKIHSDEDQSADDDGLNPATLSPSPEKSPTKSPTKTASPSKQRRDASAAAALARKEIAAKKREFDQKKIPLANQFLKDLDDMVTSGEIQRLAESTGGVRVQWNNKLATTAGRATWKKEVRRGSQKTRSSQAVTSSSANLSTPSPSFPLSNPTSQPSGHIKPKTPSSYSSSGSASTPQPPNTTTTTTILSSAIRPIHHHASIELAEKVIDSEDRLLNTLAHEYCHLANFMISGIQTHPHGTSFKQWAAKCKKALDSHPLYKGKVEITTKHTYRINYKYSWGCQSCGQEYGRHSRSIDPEKVRCGKCKVGMLLQLRPKPRNVKKKTTTTTIAGQTHEVGMGMGMRISKGGSSSSSSSSSSGGSGIRDEGKGELMNELLGTGDNRVGFMEGSMGQIDLTSP